MAIATGEREKPIGVVTPAGLALIQSDQRDNKMTTLTGVVGGFSRGSKTGTMFSPELGRGFRFEYMGAEKLAKQDNFSWSQYTQREIQVDGEFIFFFDGTIKKMLIYHAEIPPENQFE